MSSRLGRRAGAARPFHGVRFYRDAAALSTVVADFLVKGLARDEPCLVIATPEHREHIERGLRDRSVRVDELQSDAALTFLDAEQTLAAFMVEGVPDPDLFHQAVVPMLERASAARSGGSLRAYGEMVDLLWQAGRRAGAVRLETLWNELADTYDFTLLCGYAMAHVHDSAAITEICNHHSHVVSASGEREIVS